MEIYVWPKSSPKTPTHHSDVESFKIDEKGCLIIKYYDDKDFPRKFDSLNDISHYHPDEWIRFEAGDKQE